MEKETENSEPKLTFNISYYPVFQNISNILQDVHLLLHTDKENNEIFPNVLVVEFCNVKSLKDYLVRATLPKTNETRRCEPCGKKTCLVYNSIRTNSTFATEACGETFKTQSGLFNCNSEKVRLPMFENRKLSFYIGSIAVKENIELPGKETEKYPRRFFTILIVWIVI